MNHCSIPESQFGWMRFESFGRSPIYFFSQRYFVVPDSVQALSPHSPEMPGLKTNFDVKDICHSYPRSCRHTCRGRNWGCHWAPRRTQTWNRSTITRVNKFENTTFRMYYENYENEEVWKYFGWIMTIIRMNKFENVIIRMNTSWCKPDLLQKPRTLKLRSRCRIHQSGNSREPSRPGTFENLLGIVQDERLILNNQ